MRAHAQPTTTTQSGRHVNRILWNNATEIDEIVVSNPQTVHVEQLDDECWWIGITLADGETWHGTFNTYHGALTFTELDDAGIVWDRDETHEATP
jgi:hypothetical protein